jgi:glycosyltransferase involved in cell wall biosynthesis
MDGLAGCRADEIDVEALQAQILDEVQRRRRRGGQHPEPGGRRRAHTASTLPPVPERDSNGLAVPALAQLSTWPIAWSNLENCLHQVEQFRDLAGPAAEAAGSQGPVRRVVHLLTQALGSCARFFMKRQVTFNQASVNMLHNLAHGLRQLELSREAYLQQIHESLALLRYELMSQERRLNEVIAKSDSRPRGGTVSRRLRVDGAEKARSMRLSTRTWPLTEAAESSTARAPHAGGERPARVAIMVPCVMNADAVSADVLGMYRVLEAKGHEVCIFAYHWSVQNVRVEHFTKLLDYVADENALLLYHHSIGWGEGFQMLSEARCKRVIKYHNVTPPHFFSAYHIDYVNACRVGRQQIPWFAGARCDRYLCDSEYNREELITEGVSPAHSGVVPPFHNIERLHAIEADLSVLDACRDGKTNILAVGRLAPNKGHATLIEAFAIYHHEYDPNSRLLIVGKEDERLQAYTHGLRRRVTELGLDNAVVFVGEVTDHALKAYYLVADLFLMTSEHEGFCVPLIEAMALKVPIVAGGSTAIPGTLGSAGIVWEEPEADLLAHSIHAVVREEETRVGLGVLGQRRYEEEFAPERIEDQFLAAVDGLL